MRLLACAVLLLSCAALAADPVLGVFDALGADALDPDAQREALAPAVGAITECLRVEREAGSSVGGRVDFRLAPPAPPEVGGTEPLRSCLARALGGASPPPTGALWGAVLVPAPALVPSAMGVLAALPRPRGLLGGPDRAVWSQDPIVAVGTEVFVAESGAVAPFQVGTGAAVASIDPLGWFRLGSHGVALGATGPLAIAPGGDFAVAAGRRAVLIASDGDRVVARLAGPALAAGLVGFGHAAVVTPTEVIELHFGQPERRWPLGFALGTRSGAVCAGRVVAAGGEGRVRVHGPGGAPVAELLVDTSATLDRAQAWSADAAGINPRVQRDPDLGPEFRRWDVSSGFAEPAVLTKLGAVEAADGTLTFEGPTPPFRPLRATALACAGDRVAVGGEHGRVLLWDLSDRQNVPVLDLSEQAVRALAFDPSGTKLFAMDQAGRWAIWTLPGAAP